MLPTRSSFGYYEFNLFEAIKSNIDSTVASIPTKSIETLVQPLLNQVSLVMQRFLTCKQARSVSGYEFGCFPDIRKITIGKIFVVKYYQ